MLCLMFTYYLLPICHHIDKLNGKKNNKILVVHTVAPSITYSVDNYLAL